MVISTSKSLNHQLNYMQNSKIFQNFEDCKSAQKTRHHSLTKKVLIMLIQMFKAQHKSNI